MSYELRIWDPARHAPVPTTASEALDLVEQLTPTGDTRNPRLEQFGASLRRHYDAEPAETHDDPGGVAAFWGSDPRESTAACRSAVYQLSIPIEDCTRQIAHAVEAAREHGLILVDDETGVCFLPDGRIFPEDLREMWEANLADLKAGPVDPDRNQPDSRTLLQKLAGELWDSIGRGSNHQS